MIESISENGAHSADLKRSRRRRSAAVAVEDRLPPHSIECEMGILGCVLLSPVLISVCVAEIGRSDVFYDLRHGLIYSEMVAMSNAGEAIDVITLQQRLKDKNLLDRVGGIAYLAALPDTVPSAANLSYYLDIVLEKYQLRKIISTCTDVIGRIYSDDGPIEDLLFSVRSDLGHVFKPQTQSVGQSFTWSDLTSFETTQDANNVIGMRNGMTTRYLCRGQSAWLIGPSGVGKSSLLFQFGAAFCVNKPAFGITPMRALRVLLVQAENDRGDLAEMAKGIEHGMGIEWDERLDQNIRVRSVKGKIGQAFCSWLRKEIEDFRADLVMVDPLLSFAGIDVSRQDQVSQFCRVWMDPVLEDTGAVLIAAHHTGKPQRPNGKHDAPPTLTELAYAGIGSSELVNWARAIMLLQTAGENTFRLALAKRGKRAWATHPNGEFALTLWLQHSANGIYWNQIDPPEEVDKRCDKEVRLTKPQQIASCNLGTFLSLCPADGEGRNQIVKRLKQWLSSKDSPQKSLAGCGDGTLRNAVLLMLDSGKLLLNDRYFKGPNA